MMIDFEDVSSQIEHKGERGTSREEIFSTYFRKYIPLKYEFSRGAIIDLSGRQSKQQDLIIHDTLSSPILMNMDSTKIIPIESVFATIEIKSSLNKSRLNECVENIKSVRGLPKHPITPFVSPTAGFVFAYTSDTSLETLLDNLVDLNLQVDSDHQISVVCVLDKGMIVNVDRRGLDKIELLPSVNTTRAIIENSIENNLIIFYLILMQFLNSTAITPPDLLKYVEKEDLAKIQYSIPKRHVPLDGTYNFDGQEISMQAVTTLIDDMDRFKRIQTKRASSTEIMEYFSDNFDAILSMGKFSSDSIFNFFGKDYFIGQLKLAFELYKKIKNGEKITDQENEYCREIEKDLFKQYQAESDIS
ncbi:DUF6602 domain-containing protein [Paenibacillus cookii]|uniref:DUF6602 domain-containing protein n=1 Tax=Paenibacillus cookii TaxID=157839 RepID=A0ABQ4M4E4_9BACL|nr:DUF6602 domain-containing protein [Paenibacillus cookii]GIO70405.1 hypothetical protein J21TS3_52260 [Paenibacillus cookii]